MTVGARSASVTRSGDDQRNLQRGVVHENAVRVFAVLPKRFPMIAGDDDQCVVASAKRFDDAADGAVGGGNLFVVSLEHGTRHVC
jgi:hypothetical protein